MPMHNITYNKRRIGEQGTHSHTCWTVSKTDTGTKNIKITRHVVDALKKGGRRGSWGFNEPVQLTKLTHTTAHVYARIITDSLSIILFKLTIYKTMYARLQPVELPQSTITISSAFVSLLIVTSCLTSFIGIN